MAIKKPRINLAELGIVTETPAQRQARIESGRYSAQSHLDRLAENTAREDERTRRIQKKITSGGLWLDMRDLMGGVGELPPVNHSDPIWDKPPMRQGHQRLTEEFPTHHDDMLMEDYAYGERATQKARPTGPIQKARPLPPATNKVQSLREDMAPIRRASPPQPQTPPWCVKKFLGETRGGDTVSVWMVSNQRTGTTDKMFRIECVAQKVAALLNETGDPNDPRSVSLIAAYDKRDRLLKEARQLEKTADGKPMKTERLRAVRAEINQLDYRLGI